ncbi:MAG: tetratricopeptide repeat protein [Bacteroidales bacterium]|nr:tetratricopeptide repeat protein [Bacteroidales bacterium]
MKKILLTLSALVLSVGLMSAQDLAQATETYNNGASALSAGEKASALAQFQNALKLAQACGDEGAEIVENCKNVIPSIGLSIAKDLIKAEEYDNAVAKLQDAVKLAEQFSADEVIEEAKGLIPQVMMQKGASLLNAKDYAGAVAAYQSIVDADPANGVAALRLGMALTGAGKTADAIKAFEAAAANGQEATAKKQIANLYLKDAAAALKEKKYADAFAAAVKVNEYAENAQAFLVAGQAAQQLKKNNDAIANFEKYIELSPTAKNAAAITFTVAALYQQAGNKAKALENYKKVTGDASLGAQAKQQVEALSK